MGTKTRLFLSVVLMTALTGCCTFSSAWGAFPYIFNSSSVPVPILMYHSVSNKIFSKNVDLFTRPREFEKQLKFITRSGYTPIFADQLNKAYAVRRPIVLTFDDGYEDNYSIVFKLIKKYNVKITIFVPTRLIDKKYHLTNGQIREMSKSGLVSIQSHTVSHKHLSVLPLSEVQYELKQSMYDLYIVTGKYPTAVAFPYGDFNPSILAEARKFYSLGFGTSKGGLSNGPDQLAIRRYGIGRPTALDDIKKYLNSIEHMNSTHYAAL